MRYSTKILLLSASLVLVISFSGISMAQCTTNCTPLNETFGSTTNCTGFAQGTSNADIKNQTLMAYSPGGTNNTPDDGEYAIRCDGDENNWGWFGAGGTTISDHTADAPGQTGNFALINSGAGPREIYHKTVSNLCTNTTYRLTYYAGNIVRDNTYGNMPSLEAYTFPAGTAVQTCANKTTGGCVPTGGAFLGATGNIVSETSASGFKWNSYSYNFTTGAAQTSLDLVLVSLAGNNAGFDLALDDITVTWVSGGGMSCTLPAELLFFTAKELSQKAMLQWSTASEKNFSFFSVEKSTDAMNYVEIAKVNSKGSASDITHYELSDTGFHTTSYYRLRMVDLDGLSSYSEGIVLAGNDNKDCKVFQKESGELEIRITIPQSGFIKVLVYSVLGQKYVEQVIDLSEGTNVIVKDFHLKNENVLIRILAPEGEVLFSDIIPSVLR